MSKNPQLSINGEFFNTEPVMAEPFFPDAEDGFLRIQYDLDRYDFPGMVAKMLEVKTEDLPFIHEKVNRERAADYFVTGISRTHFHDDFYRHINAEMGQTELGIRFLRCYRELLQELRSKFIDFDFYPQWKPCFRVQLPNGKTITPHRDHDPNDPLNQSPKTAVSAFIPLTEARDSSTVQIETIPESGNFKALNGSPGELIFWNGAALLHKNIPNVTTFTRTSLDFRILPVRSYSQIYGENHSSINLGVPFTASDDGYFSPKEVSNLGV